MNKKSNTSGSSGRIGLGKSATTGGYSKSTINKEIKKSEKFSMTGGKSSSLAESHKNFIPSSSTNPKSSKSTFGIIWIPTRRNKQKKDYVYNPHKDDHSKERTPTMYNLMSGDSSNNIPHKKKEEEHELLPVDRIGAPVASAAGVGFVATAEGAEHVPSKENQDLTQRDHSKDAAGDAKDDDYDDDDDDYLENEGGLKSTIQKSAHHNAGDNVDSVYLRPVPRRVHSTNTSAPEDESCGLKCLYYTLQCCDCVLM